jgi:hypothetical protein
MWSTSVRIGLGIGLGMFCASFLEFLRLILFPPVVLAIIASIAFTIMRKRRLTQINQSYIPGGPGRGGPAPTSYNAPYGGYPPTDQAYPTAWYPDPNTPGQFGYQPSGNQGPTYPQYPPQSYQANESPHNQVGLCASLWSFLTLTRRRNRPLVLLARRLLVTIRRNTHPLLDHLFAKNR